jgi:hypothetical protein
MTGSTQTLKMKLAAGSALLALTLLAMGLKGLQLPPSFRPSPSVGPGGTQGLLLPLWLVLATVSLFALAVALLGIWVLRALWRRRRKVPDERVREQPRPGLLAQALALLITALLLGGLIYGFYRIARIPAPALQTAGPPSVSSPPVPSSREPQAPTSSSPSLLPTQPPEPFQTLRWALITLGALTALGLFTLWLQRWCARFITDVEAQQQREELAACAGRAAEELIRGGRLRDVVLRCYRDMVAILTQQAEVQMAPDMTAREFAARLRVLGLADEPVDVLTALFERVRYGGETLNESERQRAVEALRAIERRSGRPASEPTSAQAQGAPSNREGVLTP